MPRPHIRKGISSFFAWERPDYRESSLHVATIGNICDMELYRQFRWRHILLQKGQIVNSWTHLESAVRNCAWVDASQQLDWAHRELLSGAF